VVAERSCARELELERRALLHPLFGRERAVVGHHVMVGLEQRVVVVRPSHVIADVHDDRGRVELVAPARADGNVDRGRARTGGRSEGCGEGNGEEKAGGPFHRGEKSTCPGKPAQVANPHVRPRLRSVRLGKLLQKEGLDARRDAQPGLR